MEKSPSVRRIRTRRSRVCRRRTDCPLARAKRSLLISAAVR